MTVYKNENGSYTAYFKGYSAVCNDRISAMKLISKMVFNEKSN